MALSMQACRFGLPMDTKEFEQMTPQEYLQKYCVIIRRRQNLYHRVFVLHKVGKGNTIAAEGLEMALRDTVAQTIKVRSEIVQSICYLLDVDNSTVIDFSLFSVIAALMERMMYPLHVTEDTIENPDYLRERIETVDFEDLDWRLRGINVGQKMLQLLYTIKADQGDNALCIVETE